MVFSLIQSTLGIGPLLKSSMAMGWVHRSHLTRVVLFSNWHAHLPVAAAQVNEMPDGFRSDHEHLPTLSKLHAWI